MDWAFLSIGGVLIGMLFRCAWYTARYEPEVKRGYAFVGAGVVLVVTINTWVDLTRELPDRFRAATLVAYVLVAAGLVLIIRERRAAHRPERGGTTLARDATEEKRDERDRDARA